MIVVVVTQITYLSKLNKLYFKMSEFYFIKLYFKKDALLKKILKHIILQEIPSIGIKEKYEFKARNCI